MVFNVNAGHCPDGLKDSKGNLGACGSVDKALKMYESTEARAVKKYVIKWLRIAGHTVYDCTCDVATDQSTCLEKQIDMFDSHPAALNISIHFNSARDDEKGDGKIGGYELFAYKWDSIRNDFADLFSAKMKSLKFSAHGAVKKDGSHLKVCRKTSSKTILVEVCFVDDKDDADLYKKVGAEAIGKAIAEALHGGDIVRTVKIGDTVRVIKDADRVEKRPLWIRNKPNGKKTGDSLFGDTWVIEAVKVEDGEVWGQIAANHWICCESDCVEIAE